MNILMLISNPFTTEPRAHDEAVSLIQAGHNVTVLACDRAGSLPPSETVDGIKLVRVKLGANPARGFLWPLRFGFMLLWWQLNVIRQVLAIDRKFAIDVLHCNDFDTLPAGLVLKRIMSLPLVYDAREIYGLIMMDVLPRLFGRIFLKIERVMLKGVTGIITVTEPLVSYYREISCKPVILVMNCKNLPGPEYSAPPNTGKLKILYIGLLDSWRYLTGLIECVGRLDGVHCTIGGVGKPEYVEYLVDACRGNANIDFIGEVPMANVLPLTMASDCVFMMIAPSHPYGKVALANKQFEAMACGRPVICTRGTYIGELTEKEDAGICAEYSVDSLCEALTELRDTPELRELLGRNAIRAAREKYNWPLQAARLVEFYEAVEKDIPIK